jgi:hypothetical protein
MPDAPFCRALHSQLRLFPPLFLWGRSKNPAREGVPPGAWRQVALLRYAAWRVAVDRALTPLLPPFGQLGLGPIRLHRHIG